MTSLYPHIEPYEHGLLDVGDGHNIYWETCGNPHGKPALVLHGGPGSGCTDWHRRLFDAARYRVVLFDQRNCGRSTPRASQPTIDLSANTTENLVADIERLRDHLGVDSWLVLGGSWGSTLALVYAEQHPDRVTEIVLFGVTTGRHSEFDWAFRSGLAAFFPEQWERLCAGVPPADHGRDIVEAYNDLLLNPDLAVHQLAAENWCLWESASPAWPPTDGLAERFMNPAHALAFARIVTHYVRHNAWLEDGILLRNADRLAGTPGVLINGCYDFQAPIGNAWALKHSWPRAEIVIVDESGHTPTAALTREIVRATDRFA
jgi:proline iminopeptidase